MAMYWVIGGEYRDTGFDELIGKEKKYGPFESFEAAEAKWNQVAWQSVDDANSRYRIERMEEYWVIGGEYTDTSFTELKGEEQRFGPYATFEAAEVEWQKRAWQEVDDCHMRYRIVEG
jgi:hypothetical protein